LLAPDTLTRLPAKADALSSTSAAMVLILVFIFVFSLFVCFWFQCRRVFAVSTSYHRIRANNAWAGKPLQNLGNVEELSRRGLLRIVVKLRTSGLSPTKSRATTSLW